MKVQMKNRNKLFVIWTSLNTLFKIMKLTVSYKYDCIFYLLYMLFSTCYIHIAIWLLSDCLSCKLEILSLFLGGIRVSDSESCRKSISGQKLIEVSY